MASRVFALVTRVFQMVRKSTFAFPHEIKSVFATAGLLRDGYVVFNIGGNKYRLVVHVRYDLGIVFGKSVLTHKQYDERIAKGHLVEKRGRNG